MKIEDVPKVIAAILSSGLLLWVMYEVFKILASVPMP